MSSSDVTTRLGSILRRVRGDALVREQGRAHRRALEEMRRSVDRLEAEVGGDLALRLDSLERSIAQLDATLRSAAGAPESSATATGPVITADLGSWRSVAQEGELSFHKRPNIRSGDEWVSSNDRMWRGFGFEPSGWDGKVVVDIGAGSRLRSLFFEGSRIIAVEPLADQYVAEVEWHDLDRAEALHSVPAETEIPELEGTADLVVSINALDHGYEFDEAVRNIASYVKPDGLVFLSYDEHSVVDELHPLVISDDISREIFDRHGLAVEDFRRTAGYHPGLGGGALNYWLRPAA